MWWFLKVENGRVCLKEDCEKTTGHLTLFHCHRNRINRRKLVAVASSFFNTGRCPWGNVNEMRKCQKWPGGGSSSVFAVT